MSDGSSLRERKGRLTKRMDVLFPQESGDKCRVCNEPVVDGRWNYCSKRCRKIAKAVQRMFVWDEVRQKVLERDNYTCQECGLSKQKHKRAYWQTRERVDERADNNDEWLALWERYGDLDLHIFEVDHITPVSKGGHPFEESNLQTLCEDCHQRKTAEENTRDGIEEYPRPEISLTEYLNVKG